MSQMPPAAPSGVLPHRGVLILVFGILGFVICFIFGIVAWTMGSGDLKQMDAGLMDPTGRGLTQAGKILGMIATFLNLAVLCLWVLFFVIGLIGAAASGGP